MELFYLCYNTGMEDVLNYLKKNPILAVIAIVLVFGIVLPVLRKIFNLLFFVCLFVLLFYFLGKALSNRK